MGTTLRSADVPRRTVLLSLLLLIALAAPAMSQQMAVDPLWDGVAAGAGLLLAGGSELFLQNLAPSLPEGLDASQVNDFDRAALFPYSRGIDLASSGLEIASFLIPLGIVFLLPSDQWLGVTLVYAESMSAAVVIKNGLKWAIPRTRPYMYPGGTARESPTDRDWYASFPSGHTTVAFAAATFGSVLFASYFPGSPWVIPVIAGSYSVALLTGSFRVLAGQHFMTDVLAGAAIGAACGYLIPLLHQAGAISAASGKSIRVEIPLVSVSL
jgi:membrane-associated phospholipid phosphatase